MLSEGSILYCTLHKIASQRERRIMYSFKSNRVEEFRVSSQASFVLLRTRLYSLAVAPRVPIGRPNSKRPILHSAILNGFGFGIGLPVEEEEIHTP